MLYSVGSYGVELEADAVASSLIGVDAVERGIHDMAIVEGSLTKKRLARLGGLAEANAMRGRYRTANARALAEALEAEPTGDETAYAGAYNASP
jgi:hypothetical protein